VVKFVFSHLNLRKQPFLLKFPKSRGSVIPLRCPWIQVNTFSTDLHVVVRQVPGYMPTQISTPLSIGCKAMYKNYEEKQQILSIDWASVMKLA